MPIRSRVIAVLVLLCLAQQPMFAAEPTLRDLEFSKVQDQALKLDLYLPEELKAEQRVPLVVWVHGGAWRKGSKQSVPIAKLVDHGFAIASVDYRLSTVAKFPAQVIDIRSAIAYLRNHADEYSLDADRFAIAGASAGGHLAALVGVSQDVVFSDREAAEDSQILTTWSHGVAAIVSFYGASNLRTILSQSTPHGLRVRVPALELLLGGQPEDQSAIAEMASPIVHVDGRDPPLLMLHGDQDPQMPINQSHELEGAYRKHNLRVEFDVVHGAAHGGAEFYTDERLAQVANFLAEFLDIR